MIVEMVKGQVARDRQAKDGMLTAASAAKAVAIEKISCDPKLVISVDYDLHIDSYTVLIKEVERPIEVLTFDGSEMNELGDFQVVGVPWQGLVRHDFVDWRQHGTPERIIIPMVYPEAPPTGESSEEDGA